MGGILPNLVPLTKRPVLHFHVKSVKQGYQARPVSIRLTFSVTIPSKGSREAYWSQQGLTLNESTKMVQPSTRP